MQKFHTKRTTLNTRFKVQTREYMYIQTFHSAFFFSGMPAGPRPPFGGMRPGAGPGGQPHGPAGGGIGGVAPLE